MKLFLSSMHPSNHNALLTLLDKRRGTSVLLVTNGWDTYPKDRFEQELGHTLEAFRDLDLSTSQLDLKTAGIGDVQAALKEKALVWVMAGNTFYLNFYLHRSGFAGVIRDEMHQGLVYGGESAGAAVAGPTIRGVEKVDDHNEGPEVVWEGLGLVEFGVIPHYGWEKYRQSLEDAKTEMEKYVRVKTMSNQQAIVCVDNKVEVIENPSDEAE
jgi:dipeptidase E